MVGHIASVVRSRVSTSRSLKVVGPPDGYKPHVVLTAIRQVDVDLPGYELWLHYVDNVHVLSMAINVTKFEEALSKALQLYPHAAGQLRFNDGRWSIEVTNTAVPVDIVYQLNSNSDPILKGDWVIQDHISPLLSQQPIGADLVNGGAPLLRLKLTFFKDETCIGISWHHTLGDAIALSRFMHTLSQFYQGLPSEFAPPTFKKHVFPAPSDSVMAEVGSLMPHLSNMYPFNELGAAYAEASKGVENLRWRLDGDELEELRSAFVSHESKATHLSTHDCLTAYIVAVLNYRKDERIEKITNASSYRNVSAPFIDENVAGNCLQNVPAAVPMDMAGIAAASRTSLAKCREPEYIDDWITTASSLMLNAANTGKSFFFAPHDNVMTINSNTVIDWCSAHFGCPDGSRFHTSGFAKYYMRSFRSNPMKGADGVWQARPGSVEVSMGVPAELRPKLLETLACGVQYMLENQRT